MLSNISDEYSSRKLLVSTDGFTDYPLTENFKLLRYEFCAEGTCVFVHILGGYGDILGRLPEYFSNIRSTEVELEGLELLVAFSQFQEEVHKHMRSLGIKRALKGFD